MGCPLPSWDSVSKTVIARGQNNVPHLILDYEPPESLWRYPTPGILLLWEKVDYYNHRQVILPSYQLTFSKEDPTGGCFSRELGHKVCWDCQYKIPDWMALTVEIFCLEAGGPRSRCWQVWFLLGPLVLACRWPTFHHVLALSTRCMHIPVSVHPDFLFL